MTALHEAILRDDLPTIRRILPPDPKQIDECNAQGEPLAHVAARECGLATLQYLVEYGLRVNLSAVDAQGRDLLHYAAQSGSVEKCRYLVERGGMDALRGDLDLVTPIQLARDGGHTELLHYFESVVGTPFGELIANPIRRGMFPDPSIVRVGEDYYMVNSTFIFFPCIPVSHSRDLVHWHIIGHAITVPEWAELNGLEGGRGYWAPDISYCNGRFFICATYRMNDGGQVARKQMVVSAERPEGPYSKPVFIDEDGIDPSLFHDDDGRHYMLLNRGGRIFEVDDTCTRRIGEPTLLYYGSQKRAPEGPHLLKKDGWYYLFLAEGGTGMGHRETVARSRTLFGVYQPSPYGDVLRQRDERAIMQRCGHAKPVQLPDGRWYMVYLCGRAIEGKYTLLGRETALDALVWTQDGWPLVKQPSTLQPRPLPSCPVAETVDWLTPRPPQADTIRREGERVWLRGSPFPLTDTRCRSLLLRRQTAFRFTFEALLRVPASGEAGVCCYYDEHSFLTLGVRASGASLVVREQEGMQARIQPEMPIQAKAGELIRLRVEADGLTRKLSYAQNGDPIELSTLENVTYLSDEGVSIGKRFTGAMVGVYALDDVEALFEKTEYQEA